MKKMNIKVFSILALAGLAFAGCAPEENETDNGLVNTLDLDPSFTVTETGANKYRVESTETRATSHYWSDGTISGVDGNGKDYFFPDAGTYTLTHRVCGLGGQDCVETAQLVNVPVSDPVQGNIIVNPRFQGGQDPWQVLQIAANNDVAWTFSEGFAKVSGGNGGHQAIYQAIQVEGGHNYRFDFHVSSTTGAIDTWFELYADYTAPVQNSDYTAGGKLLQLNTWDGCGQNPVDGQLADLSCGGTSGSVKHFDTSGTVYVVLKSGGSNIPGFNVTNFEVRRID